MKLRTALLLTAGLLANACSKDAPTTQDDPRVDPKDRSMNIDLLADAPKQAEVGVAIKYEAISGHHFELAAPQQCGDAEPTQKAASAVTCQFAAPGKQQVRLNICLDDKSACKPVRYSVEVSGDAVDAPAQELKYPPKTEHPPVQGFIMNDPAAAQAQAKAGNKLLFVHFYGIWCPPCNALEEHVYAEDSFQQATKDMVRLMLDADSDVSWAWKDHFKVGGYPTVVIANADLDEIDRIVGSRPVASVNKWAKDSAALAAQPIAKVLADNPDPAAADAAVRLRLGKHFAERKEWDAATKWLDGLDGDEGKKELMLAKRAIAKDADQADEVKRLTRELARSFPDALEHSWWVEEMLDGGDLEKSDPLVQTTFANLKRWRSAPELADTGYSVADLWWNEADIRKQLAEHDAARDAYLKAAAEFEQQAKTSNLSVARGANLERAYALYKAGENEEAKKLYDTLVAEYPKEFTFHYNYASVLNKLEDFDKAHVFALKAEESSYGDNWLRAVHLRARIEEAQGRKDDALATIDGALAKAVVPELENVRTHRYIKNLENLRAEIEAAGDSQPKSE